MELRVYLRLLQKRWWVVLSLFVIALVATAFFTLRTKPVYQASATYIVRLSSFAEERNTISALNTLTSRTEIAATYAGVANSSLIRNMAADALGIPTPGDLSVESQMKSGMNILEITVRGNDPVLVRDYTNAIGMQTVGYVESLYETYRLEPLDEATLPSSPLNPNMAQNLTLGGILGLVLGMGLVILMEYLRIPAEAGGLYNILDDRSGIYDMRYFRERLHQEMSRVRRHKGVLSLALINVDHRRMLGNLQPQARLEVMRSVVVALGQNLRDEDVMASFSDTGIALLLPELDGEKAKKAVERILNVFSKASVELSMSGRNVNLNGAVGIAPFHSWDRASTDVLIERAQNVLESMRESTYGKVMVSTEGPTSSIVDSVKNQEEGTKNTGPSQQAAVAPHEEDESVGQNQNRHKSPNVTRNEPSPGRLGLAEQEG